MNPTLSILSGHPVDNSVIDQGFVGNSQQTAGCFIKTLHVNSITTGTVLAVEKDPDTSSWIVTIEFDSSIWIRYCYLSATSCIVGKSVLPGTFIGNSYKGKIKLEYCTSEKSKFPVRIDSKQLYKHDPTFLIFSEEV